MPEITEEDDEEVACIIDKEAQKESIRKIIQYQRSLYLSSSSTSSLSSSAASCSSFSSSRRSSSLLDLMKGGSTSLRRLFDMEHTSLSTHFQNYSGSPIVKPIPLWGSDTDDEIPDPWALFKQIRPTEDPGTEGQSKFGSVGSFMDSEFGVQNKKTRIKNRRLIRTKSFRRLPGFGLWRCRGFRFRFRLRLRRLKILICGRRFDNNDA